MAAARDRRLWLAAAVGGVIAATATHAGWDRLLPAEWQRHQRAYNRLLVEAGRPPVAEGIRAVQPKGGPEERCVSCHLGALLADAPGREPLFSRHPPLRCGLELAALGCVSCHRGDPARLDVEHAHATLLGRRAGPRREQLLQAGCAQCHRSRASGVLRYDADVVPQVARGLQLFVAQGCPACHRVDGVHVAAERAPRLSSVGLRRSRAWLRQQLRLPRRRNPASPMPPTEAALTGAELDALLTFLQAQIGVARERGGSPVDGLERTRPPRLADHLDLRPPAEPSRAAGALWMRRVGCLGCHRLGDADGGVVDLRQVGWIATEEELRQALRRPGRRFPGTLMPALGLPPPVMDSILQNLAAQRRPLPSSPGQVFATVCRRCHGPGPDPRVVVLGRRPPPLGQMRGRPTRQRFLEVGTRGSAGTAMAPWGRVLSRSFLGAIHDGLATKLGRSP